MFAQSKLRFYNLGSFSDHLHYSSMFLFPSPLLIPILLHVFMIVSSTNIAFTKCHKACKRLKGTEGVTHLVCHYNLPTFAAFYCHNGQSANGHEYVNHTNYFLNRTVISNNTPINYFGPFFSSCGDNGSFPLLLETSLFNHGHPFFSHAHYQSYSSALTHTHISIPDPHFLKTDGFNQLITWLNTNPIPYHERSRTVFWRGSSTGIAATCDALPRVRACDIASRTPWMNMSITGKLLTYHHNSTSYLSFLFRCQVIARRVRGRTE